MSDVLFSIATPTRNALPLLRRCVGSVRGQRNIEPPQVEHLIQDADSRDGTGAWLRAQGLAQAASEPDAGMYDAINRAWARSSGEVLSWLNADEQYLPGTLDFVHRWFTTHPTADVLFGDYIVTAPDGRAVALRREIPFRRAVVANSFLYAASCTLFYRRRLLDSGLLRLDATLRYAADKDLLLRLADAGAVIVHQPRTLALFGIDGNNLSTHPAMLREAEEVRRRHGAFASPLARSLLLGARRVERALRGAYFPRPEVYEYALDEAPRYATFSTAGTGGRYRLDAVRT